jgi:hypothetical protein
MPREGGGIQYSATVKLHLDAAAYWITRWSLSSGSASR